MERGSVDKVMAAPADTPDRPTVDARRYLYFAAVGVLLVTCFEILDFVELPFESVIGHAFTSGATFSTALLTSTMTGYGYAGLFALMALESASVPIPSEVILPFAGFLVFEGSMNFVVAVAVSGVAGLAGAMADYLVARRFGRPLAMKLLHLLGAGGEQLAQTEAWLNEKGSWSVLLARFVPGIRSSVSLPAGVAGMRLRSFATMTLVGVLGWSVLLISLGYSAGSLWQSAVGRSSPLFVSLSLYAAAVGSALYIGHYLASSRESRGGRRER